jgi:hypothetical protein
MKIRLLDGTGTIDLKYIYEDRDRHGKCRIYYRRKGQRKIKLLARPGTQEFLDEYRKAHSGIASDAKLSKTAPPGEGTLRFLITQYYGSAEFWRLESSTQRARRLILDNFCDEPLDPSVSVWKE